MKIVSFLQDMLQENEPYQCEHISVYNHISTKELFISLVQDKRQPAVIRGVDVGECCSRWTSEYLVDKVGHHTVKVHVSPDSQMNFINKNFVYKTLTLGETITRASSSELENYFISPNEYYYLRSLSSERRGREVSHLQKQFPEITNDIKIPKFFNDENFFSSVLRISSKDIQLWTHYDVMDNLLIQVRGKKRVVLFDPADVKYLYMEGDKSKVLDVDNPDLAIYPDFVKAKKYVSTLDPGDILYIPALWLHNTVALTYGVAVNVFWKNLELNLYDKNDFYGNKDLLPAAKVIQK